MERTDPQTDLPKENHSDENEDVIDDNQEVKRKNDERQKKQPLRDFNRK
jgi:hypothetical protein